MVGFEFWIFLLCGGGLFQSLDFFRARWWLVSKFFLRARLWSDSKFVFFKSAVVVGFKVWFF